jgi:hypothetical protein
MEAQPCPLCGQPLKNCLYFKKFKKKISKYNYLYKLRYNDRLGFCSSGIILYYIDGSKIKIFMINEIKFNFPGGKREWYYDKQKNEYDMERYDQTALREFIEEVSKIYSIDSLNLIIEYIKKSFDFQIWIANNKMVYNIIKIPKHLAPSSNKYASWFDINELISNNFDGVFEFCKEVINIMDYLNFKKYL